MDVVLANGNMEIVVICGDKQTYVYLYEQNEMKEIYNLKTRKASDLCLINDALAIKYRNGEIKLLNLNFVGDSLSCSEESTSFVESKKNKAHTLQLFQPTELPIVVIADVTKENGSDLIWQIYHLRKSRYLNGDITKFDSESPIKCISYLPIERQLVLYTENKNLILCQVVYAQDEKDETKIFKMEELKDQKKILPIEGHVTMMMISKNKKYLFLCTTDKELMISPTDKLEFKVSLKCKGEVKAIMEIHERKCVKLYVALNNNDNLQIIKLDKDQSKLLKAGLPKIPAEDDEKSNSSHSDSKSYFAYH